MTTQLSPLAVQRFEDNSGFPLAGGLLYTYAAGTSTPQATYIDSTGGTPNANPIVLNARGEANIWLTSGQTYKFALQDSGGNPIWTVDNVLGGSSASSITIDGVTLDQQFASRVNRVVDSINGLRALSKLTYTRAFVTGYYSAGDGGGGNYWYDPTDVTSADNGGTIIVATDGGRWKLIIATDFVSAKQFGAKLDGVTDDSAIINNSKSALDALGKRLYLPAGSCFIGTTIIPPRAGVLGDSPQSSAIICNGVPAFTFPSTFGLARPACVIEKLNISSYHNTCDSLYAFYAPGVASGAAPVWNSGLTVRDVEIGSGGRFGGGFALKDFFRVNVEDVGMTNVSQMVNLTGSVIQATFTNVTANSDNAPTSLARYGFVLQPATYSTGTLTPEHISTWDCSAIRFNTGIVCLAGLFISFNNTDLETFQFGYNISAPCTIRDGIAACSSAAAGTTNWVGIFINNSDFNTTNGVLIDGVDVNTLNMPGTPSASYGIIVGNGTTKSVGTIIRGVRVRGLASSLVNLILAQLSGGDVVIEDCLLNGAIATSTSVLVSGASYARVVGNRCTDSGTINGSLTVADNGTGTVGMIRANEFSTITNTVNAYSGTWAPGAINNGTAATTTVSVPGANAGDQVIVGLSSLIGTANCIISGYVQVANSVRVIVYNVSGSTQTIPSGTLNVSVVKQ